MSAPVNPTEGWGPGPKECPWVVAQKGDLGIAAMEDCIHVGGFYRLVERRLNGTWMVIVPTVDYSAVEDAIRAAENRRVR